MGKIRRGGYLFLTWIGDHGGHVHVLRDGRKVLKWDLLGNAVIRGKASCRILTIIRKLQEEGKL